MDLTMVDLGALADPARCADAEPSALEMARFFVELPAQFERALSREQRAARALFIRVVAAHWPADGTRPREISALLQRYAEQP